MKITKNYQLGIFYFICCVLIAILTAYLFNTFSGAMCMALATPMAFAAVVFASLGVFKTFLERGGIIDTQDLEKPIDLKIKAKFLIILAILAVGFYMLKPIKPIVRMYNTNIAYVNKYEKVQQERKMFYDKMWKTYLTKNVICELNRETFIAVTEIIMEGRSDGQNVSWKMVHENQPIPYDQFTSFYKDLSNFVTSQRESYFNLERQAMEVIQQQNGMLDSFPNNLYNAVLKIEKLKYSPGFTSTQTERVFDSKIEDL